MAFSAIASVEGTDANGFGSEHSLQHVRHHRFAAVDVDFGFGADRQLQCVLLTRLMFLLSERAFQSLGLRGPKYDNVAVETVRR